VAFVGYFQEPTLNIAMLRLFDIHPMFRPHLGIQPQNERRHSPDLDKPE